MDGIICGIAGMDWTEAENNLLVTDYFAMLGEEVAGRPYVKRRHRRAIVEQTGRSEGSVERKYMNVSAVLEKLGLPRIRGNVPAPHAQLERRERAALALIESPVGNARAAQGHRGGRPPTVGRTGHIRPFAALLGTRRERQERP